MFSLTPRHRQTFDPVLVQDPVVLRTARAADFEEWLALREESRAHLTRWEDDWPDSQMTFPAFKRRLQLQNQEMRRSRGLFLLAFSTSAGKMVGGASLSAIRYGPARAATLGYWIGAAFVRRGYGSACVKAMCAHAFERLGLNRVAAACQPENAASQNLLKTCGFQHEGLARDYLRINGVWRDHLIFARTEHDHREGRNSDEGEGNRSARVYPDQHGEN